jgi:hypothetical protein
LSNAELNDVIYELEKGGTLRDIHERYRNHNQATGGRAYWTKTRPGYGIIS